MRTPCLMTVVCVATWGATAVRSLSLAGDLDGLYSAGHGWRHPGEKRASTDNVNELIKLAKMDAIAAAAGGGDMDIPAEAPPRPRKIPRVKPADRNEGKGMLYLDCEVEGKHIKAFVDTGAQVTVMSAACAESCGILKNLDRRFAGRAVGVGSARIMGRIHNAHLRIGNTYLTCSFTVIDHSEMELLIGLDVLRKYECEISLRRNSMSFSLAGVQREVAFLKRVEMDEPNMEMP